MRGPQCRYTGKYQRCGNEAADPAAAVPLCMTHLGQVVEDLTARGFKVEAPAEVPA